VTVIALQPSDVVLVAFPFSDLTDRKLRPALVMAAAGRGDCGRRGQVLFFASKKQGQTPFSHSKVSILDIF
jgi:hypothetical protein